MTFEDWMIHRDPSMSPTKKHMSKSSAKKYAGAITGPLSSWAIEAGLTFAPLTSLSSPSNFEQIALRIQELPIFQERNERGHHMYSSALSKFAEYLSEGLGSGLEADIDAILEDEKLNKTEKSSLVKARIGQGAFRQKLLSYWRACAVTGFKETRLLVASHIKPWCASSNVERLDLFNGLLLTPNLDRAFDSGLLTFDLSGKILLSPLFTEPHKLGVSSNMRILLSPQHQPYLNFHRTNVYRPN